MKRREFLTAATGAAIWPYLSRDAEPFEPTAPRAIRITRIVGFDLTTNRIKFAGKNSRLDDHGDKGHDRMVRIYTDAGIEGIGSCRAGKEVLQSLLGLDPMSCYIADERRMVGPLGPETMPLWDLAGKIHGKPVYELLGGKGPELVPSYDGSIYFQDLLPQYADNWRDRFKKEIDMSLARGHRGFKVKVGRGAKWMERAAGDTRDVEVVKLVRQHAGPEILIGVDANNGYAPAGAKRFLEQVGDLNIAFTEEMFPETVEQCLDYKKFIASNGWKTLLADGETVGDLNAYKPFIEARAIDILQGDMRRFGFEGIMTEAAWAAEKGIKVAPHNWGSLVGFYMQLHVGRAVMNFYRAENDPLDSDVLIGEGYTLRDGKCSVPDAPGFGLKIDETKFANEVKIRFDLKD